MPKRLSAESYITGILAGDRTMLGRAITVIESRLATDKTLATEILKQVFPKTGNALRIGITGVPGVGKSTFVESFGQFLTALGKSVAVLAVDPSSKKSGGSILGDKTRMEQLAHHPLAFIRPSATGLSLGGVARNTRETMLLCEAAGYEVILVETVGVGQSETLVKGMTDFFLLLVLAGAGDEIQGIKKGIMEMVDLIAVNKADGINELPAREAVSAYQNAMHLFPANESGAPTQIMTCSALEGRGMDKIWECIEQYAEKTSANGFFKSNRQSQQIDWMHDYISEELTQLFYEDKAVKMLLQETEKLVKEGKSAPVNAAQQLLDLFLKTRAATVKS